MEIKHIVKQMSITVRDFLETEGYSRNFRKNVRLQDIVFVNGRPVRNHEILHQGDEVIIIPQETLNPVFLSNIRPLEVIYEDEYLLIINKPSGFSTQPSLKHPTDNMISMITSYYHQHHISSNIHVLTRLDYRTTGMMIVAKSGVIHQKMMMQHVTKKYLCWILGTLDPEEGIICLPIHYIKSHDIRRWVDPDGQRALTKYKTLETQPLKSLLEIELLTGRTHQIRVHMAHLGHPVIGDNLYDNQEGDLLLHCYQLTFIHPITNLEINLTNYPEWVVENKTKNENINGNNH
ncbi:MAG: RluA family pseudouridine synthase [Bacilli bacterium]